MMLHWKIRLFFAWAALTALAPVGAPAAPGVPPPAPPGVVIERETPYLSPDRAQRLDLYLPADRKPGTLSPGIVIIHGGGWVGGSKSGGREFEVGTTLAKAGYVCASVEYRMSAHDRWPTNVQDCKNAVRFLRVNAAKYGVDPAHIGVIGGSAGGHLSLMVGLTDAVPALEPAAPYPGVSDRVDAVVDMYGIADVRTGQTTDAAGNPTGVHKSWDSVFGDHRPITDADRALASPVSHIGPRTPPVLILHGTRDTTVDRNESADLDRALTAAKVPHELIWVQGAGHTFDLERWNGKRLSVDLRPTVIAFFDRYLKPSSPAGAQR
jgi:acetyl esterase/lipase